MSVMHVALGDRQQSLVCHYPAKITTWIIAAKCRSKDRLELAIKISPANRNGHRDQRDDLRMGAVVACSRWALSVGCVLDGEWWL